MTWADLIVSHAGSGSILESLSLGKRLVVVVNESLMDNHQAELANELDTQGLCVSAKPSNLMGALSKSLQMLPMPWKESDPTLFIQQMELEMNKS